MKVSIITVVYNNRETIRDAINSVLSQSYDHIEYIIIDGASTDGTVDVINEAIKAYSKRSIRVLSEKDSGIYDAMNKGIRLATGDIVGILNSDDMYENNRCVSTVVSEFQRRGVDSIFADLVYVRRDNPEKSVRYYGSGSFSPHKFAFGWMPAHPTFFVRRECYEKYGKHKTDYIIAADYELLVRFLARYGISYSYIPKVLVRMRMGGISTKSLKSNWILNREILRACAENGIKTNIFKVLSKYPGKILQSMKKPK
ncbi:MAG: glycosyltransferase family 2 protein [Pseudomonadota bacterium]